MIVNLFLRFSSILVSSVFASVNGEYAISVSSWYLALDVQMGVYRFLDTCIAIVLNTPYAVEFFGFFYSNTMIVVAGLVFLFAFHSKKLAREYMFALVIASVVSTPFWLLLPAIAPVQLATYESVAVYDTAGVLSGQTAVVMELFTKYENTNWAAVVTGWDDFWRQVYDFGWGFPVSCNPSMHIIWGVLVAFYARKIHWFFGAAGIFFLVAEGVGTMLFLQHYLIDIGFGFIIAALVIVLTQKLLTFEKRYLSVNTDAWFSFMDYMEHTGVKILSLIKGRKQ